jgi:3-oxosteroid 1-dehydrogenase
VSVGEASAAGAVLDVEPMNSVGPSVVVVGSGAAGLAAALAAAHAGAGVVVLETDALIGGTSAISGGIIWAPGHPYGDGGTADDGLAYLRELATGDVDEELMGAFAHDVARVAVEIAERTPLRWQALAGWPDYHSELPHGVDGGRSIWPRPLTVPDAIAARVRRPFEYATETLEMPANDGVALRGPVRGHTLVAGMLMALTELGVDVRTGVRVTGLAGGDGEVTGVRVGADQHDGRVVLATGGFQWDRRLAATFLPAPDIAPLGTPGCRGDGLRMAMAAGADLGNMTEGWWMPTLHAPGEVLDGEPFWRSLHSERAQAGSILVDRTGRRFVDEAQNYADVGRAMFRFDAARHEWTATRCWLVFDATYRDHQPVGPLQPDDPDPAWLLSARTVEALAARIGVPAGELADTVGRFNRGAELGVDDDFGRGSLPYDRWIGGQTLGCVHRPPFYAVEVRVGCLGTKGGPRTDDRGRVLRPDGSPIAGLYAAGNAAASPFGTATAAGGATLAPALVFGTRAGEAAAHD